MNALALAVALVTPAAAPELVITGPPVVREPGRLEGLGWIGAGALTGAVGLGLGLASAQEAAARESCMDCSRRLPPMMFAAVALNTASLGLLAVGASVRGRVKGSRAALEGRSAKAPWIALGGLATAGGVLFVAAGLGWRFASPSQDSPTPWVLLQIGLSSVTAGSALLVYGLTHRKYAANSREARLRVVPLLGWRYAGVGLAGRF